MASEAFEVEIEWEVTGLSLLDRLRALFTGRLRIGIHGKARERQPESAGDWVTVSLAAPPYTDEQRAEDLRRHIKHAREVDEAIRRRAREGR